MKRFLPFALVLCSGAWIYACSSSDSNDGSPSDTTGEDGSSNTDPNNPGNNNGDPDAAPGDDSSTPDASSGVNPIEGATAKVEPGFETVGYIDGLVWKTDSIYFTMPQSNPAVVVRYNPAAATTNEYVNPANGPLGITFDEKGNNLVFANSKDIALGTLYRMPAGSAGAVTPAALTLTYDGGTAPWYSPNDLVVRKSDGTIYVTDPGYQAGNVLNGVYRITPTGAVSQLAAYNEEHPNGIGLSPDSSTLYVSLTGNGVTTPGIVKFEIKADGSAGAPAKFVEMAAKDSKPDGLAVDSAGNVYVATTTGVQVFAPDGTKWGQIATTKTATNVAFGGADMKTLYIATDGTLQSATVKVAGLGQ